MTATTWTKIPNPSSTTPVEGGTPIGLLLALTYASSIGTQWTQIINPSGTSWTPIPNAT